MADWSNVPKDLLLKIFPMSEIPDILRSAAVCVSWSDAVRELRCSRLQLGNQSPWLMFSADEGEDNPSAARFYSLSEQKTYTIPLPEPSIRERLCVGSSHGWLITADQTSELHLLNPITVAQINLPSVLTYDHIEPVRDERGRLTGYIEHTLEVDYKLDELRLHMYFKVILSSDPSRGDYTVVVIHNPYRRISFVRAGDSKWTTLTSNYRYVDAVFHRGQLYASAGQKCLVVLDLASPHRKPRVVVPADDQVPRLILAATYLVETPWGDLLYVWRCRILISHVGKVIHTHNFVVYKVDVEGGRLVPVERSFGDIALFLGCNNSLSLALPEPIRTNCIYFTDDFILSRTVADWRHDIGVFNYEDRSISGILPSEAPLISWPPPIWFMPKF
ncbi:F-box only protein 7 [Canna indica]|uniref:F-box only protein 7 n=1 Tax=Canna indica TaxID=4628 RepID=A0AAQ3QL57_9LILI|nr:F-box only protein 7 [Canna indica]